MDGPPLWQRYKGNYTRVIRLSQVGFGQNPKFFSGSISDNFRGCRGISRNFRIWSDNSRNYAAIIAYFRTFENNCPEIFVDCPRVASLAISAKPSFLGVAGEINFCITKSLEAVISAAGVPMSSQ